MIGMHSEDKTRTWAGIAAIYLKLDSKKNV